MIILTLTGIGIPRKSDKDFPYLDNRYSRSSKTLLSMCSSSSTSGSTVLARCVFGESDFVLIPEIEWNSGLNKQEDSYK